MCVTTYQGKGYSASYVANMNRLWHALRDGAYDYAQALSVADPICGACPNLEDPVAADSCRFQASIGERDRRMMRAMGWAEGEVVELGPALDYVHAHHAELMATVCPGCEWIGICRDRRFTLREADPPVPRPED